MAVFPSFIFDSSKGETPQTIAMKRALAAQIMGGFGNRPARNVGEGVGNAFASLGQGITANVMNRRASAGEEAGQAAAGDLRQQLINSMMGQSSFPPAPNPGNTSSMASMAAPDYASARVAQAHGDSTAPAGNLTESKQAFINALMPAAIQESQRTGIDPRIIVAQAAQETGWGRSAPGNNYFGIKSHGQGGGQTFATHEYVNGKRVNIRDSFRRFDSPADSVRGYGDFILKNPRYRPFMAAQGLDAQLEALQASGYATDPNYSRSVGAIARGIPLDSPVAANEAMATGSLSNGLTPDALQQWAFANYAQPQQSGSAVDAVNALGAAQPVGVAENEADILAQEAAMAQQDPAAFAAQGAMPQAAPMQQQPIQVAQAGGFPEMAGRDPSRPPPPDLNMLMQVLSNPFMDEGTKAYAQAVLQQHMQAQDPSHQLDMDYRRAQIEKLNREAAGGNRRYGLNPIYGQDAQGNTVLGVLGDDGSFKPVDTGGVNISTGVDRVDLGTQWGLLDKRSGQMVGTLPKENYQEAFDTASGTNDAKSAAEARANLPKVEDNATAILGMIESLSTDPYLDSMVGPVSGRLPNVSADAARVQSKMDQIGGQAFLQAFEILKGGGTITEIEGQKATEAIARLNTAQNPQDYRDALNELRSIVQRGVERARRSAGMGGGTQAPPGADGWQDMGGVRIRRKQ